MAYDTHPYIPAKSLAEMPELLTALGSLSAQGKRTRVKQVRAGNVGLPQLARRLLMAASLFLYHPVARLWEKIGTPSPAIQAAIRDELESRELCKFSELRIGRRNTLLLWITKTGWQLLDTDGPRKTGLGSHPHVTLSQWLRMVGEKRGYKAKTEWVVPGTNHPCDAAWLINGKWHALEVVVACESNLASHVRACFVKSDAVASLTIVAPLKRALQRLRNGLEANPEVAPFLDRIRFQVLEPYMEELWPK